MNALIQKSFDAVMISPTASKFGLRMAAFAAVLLASAVVAPPRADASCGDYVMIGGRHVGHPPADSSQESQAPTVPNCHGPMCSNNSIPPVAPAPKVEVTVERWALPGGATLIFLSNRDVVLADARAFPYDGYGLSILRPPR
jgi:hypothetical protein